MDIASSAYLMSYAASAVATPICLLVLSRELNLNLTEGGSIEATRAILLMIILLFSGFAASRWGKTAVLHTGGVILTLGLLCYGLAPSYLFILLAMVLVGLGGGLIEALVNPLIQDLHPRDSGRYLNVINAFFSVGVLTTVLFVGELLTWNVSWRNIFAGLAFFSLLVVLFFFLSSIKAHKDGRIPPEPEGNPLHHTREILRDRHFWIFGMAMVCGGGVESAYTFWSASYIQIYYHTAPRAGAIGTAIFACGMIIGRMAGGLVKQQWLHLQILFSALAGLIISFGFFWISSLSSLFVLLFFAGLACACYWPSIQSYAADRIRGESTMLFILLSAMGIPGFALTSWIMGRMGDLYGLKTSFMLIPILFFMLILTMFTERHLGRDRTGPHRDEKIRVPDPL